ncbi:MAG TPA: RsmE family RNA methyltransferase, partial [Membranihabitans sp.]|nr:RsmE family RNA methyltransferase [Membranihabitans sp.]
DRGEVPLLEQQYQGENPVHILIGPEGDFTPAEVDASIKQGWIPVSLGNNRLRTETAATMVVQIIKSCYHIKTQTTQ